MIEQLKREKLKLQTKIEDFPITLERLVEELRKEHTEGEEQRREEFFKTIAELRQENRLI